MKIGEIGGVLGLLFSLHFSSRIPVWGIDLGSVIGLSGMREILFPVPVMIDHQWVSPSEIEGTVGLVEK